MPLWFSSCKVLAALNSVRPAVTHSTSVTTTVTLTKTAFLNPRSFRGSPIRLLQSTVQQFCSPTASIQYVQETYGILCIRLRVVSCRVRAQSSHDWRSGTLAKRRCIHAHTLDGSRASAQDVRSTCIQAGQGFVIGQVIYIGGIIITSR